MMTAFGLDVNHKSMTKNNFSYIYNVYLYGELEKENKFDAVGVDLNLYRILKTTKEQVFNINAALTNGKIYPAFLYWWHDKSGRQHGFVCKNTDTKACAYAKKHMAKKAESF